MLLAIQIQIDSCKIFVRDFHYNKEEIQKVRIKSKNANLKNFYMFYFKE